MTLLNEKEVMRLLNKVNNTFKEWTKVFNLQNLSKIKC